MPTIGELLKSATKMEYDFGGAKVTIERRSKSAVEAPKKEEREEYFALRDRVWTRLRKELKELEDFQRYLKKRMKMSPADLNFSRNFRKMIARSLEENTEKLRSVYLLIEFTRRGPDVVGAEKAERFFNCYFRGKMTFKNDFWTYWNKRHSKKVAVKGKVTVCRKTVKGNGSKPYRCPECNSFVSRKTNYCSRCKKDVSPAN